MRLTKKTVILCIIGIIVGSVSIYLHLKNTYNTKVRYNGPSKSEPYKKEKKVKNTYGNEEDIELKYDDYVVASGYAGAADNVYYTRNNILYHLRLSTNETTRIAEGIDKLEEGIDSVNAYKGEGFKIITEDNYINYID